MCADAGIAADLIGYSPLELAACQLALEQGRLPLRLQTMIPAVLLREEMAAPQDGVGRALDLGLRTGLGGDMLSVGAMKMWLDGGMMARTAALTEPNAGGGSGQLAYDYAEAYAMVIDGHRAGWQLALHAIGDRAVDQAIELLSAAQAVCPRPGARHRVEHCGLVRPDQLAGLAAVGATAVIQPTFRTRGSLAVGKHADLVVLDGDPYDLDRSALADVQIVATLLAGRVVHGDLGRTG
jgi:predicted amidohydrolase YtcJ